MVLRTAPYQQAAFQQPGRFMRAMSPHPTDIQLQVKERYMLAPRAKPSWLN
jgi:hypothetical protein